jgi:hypothetical protein
MLEPALEIAMEALERGDTPTSMSACEVVGCQGETMIGSITAQMPNDKPFGRRMQRDNRK